MATDNSRFWRLWIDTGGTFTDCLVATPDGQAKRLKVLSSGRLRAILHSTESTQFYRIEAPWSGPIDFLTGTQLKVLSATGERATFQVRGYGSRPDLIQLDATYPSDKLPHPVEIDFREEAPIVAARLATGTPFQARLPHLKMRLATTKATNALLERKGDRTAFFVTKGFGDLLRIGTQQRADLFALKIVRPCPLHDRVIEVDERIDAEGNILQPFDPEALHHQCQELRRDGFQTAAVALLNAYRNPDHERQLAQCLQASGFPEISLSHELAPFIKLLPRAETAVANAYLAPLMGRYLGTVSAAIGSDSLQLMTSAGSVIPVTAFRPKDALLSGPAGGVVGAALTGRECQHERVIAFDMGGTSTDVSRYHGTYDYQFEHQVGPAHLMAPALRIETVAAGGGSICAYTDQGLSVGPESAGALPGPACYGAGGPLTITDVNLLLGRMDSAHFGIPIDLAAAREALHALANRIQRVTQEPVDPAALLQGFLDLANERMADAIRSISIREGYDPGEYALVAFGGAGGQHACSVATRLGIRTILFPDNAGLLSAHGLRYARQEQFAERQILAPLRTLHEQLPEWVSELESAAAQALTQQGVPSNQIQISRRILQLRLQGQEATEDLEYQSIETVEPQFRSRYRTVFGYDPQDKEIEVVSLRVTASSEQPDLENATRPTGTATTPPPQTTVTDALGSAPGFPVYPRPSLSPGQTINGPAIVQDDFSTVVVDTGWEAIVRSNRTLELSRQASADTEIDPAQHPAHELVEEELFTHRFENLVTEMGQQLERTAVSTNVKDRLDFSCALLDAEGELIANAPHIPVHLGALGRCVRAVAQEWSLRPGDLIVTNHPGYGGSHLPDVTVISPVFDAQGQHVGTVANRAHHAEMGGIRPGSMPPDARNLAEEGVVIPPTYLFREGQAHWETLETILSHAPHPSRAVADNLADLRAQVAANHKGVQILQKLCIQHGTEAIQHHLMGLKHRATSATRMAIARLPNGHRQVTQSLDDGTLIVLNTTIREDALEIDFTGTAESHPGNFHATPAIVTSAVIYVLRLLIQKPLPLNEGLMQPVTLRLPRCFLNPEFPKDPKQCPAVVAGNVETSQRLVDALIQAFDIAACSQGTMNNLIFGNERLSYYETIAGGAGAGPGFHGAHAVHTHMTNTGITDPEILERRFPVLLEEFRIRPQSGGTGQFTGGNGVIRRLRFTETVDVSLLTQHRNAGPYGSQGGQPGQPGRQRIIRQTGQTESLPAIANPTLHPGDTLVIETPGGGGWGVPDASQPSTPLPPTQSP